MAMCLSLAAFNRLPAACAGAHPRPAAASARPFPTTSRRCSAWSAPTRSDVPVITIDGPTASGKGTLASARGRARWATTCSTPARCTAPPRWRRCGAASAADDAAGAGSRWPRIARPALRRATRVLARRRGREPTRCATRRSARWPRGSRRCPRCAQALHGAAAVVPPRCPGLVADGRDMGTRGLPRRAAQGVPHRERRASAPSGGISN